MWTDYSQRKFVEAAKEYAELSSSEREMRILRSDRERTRRLAGDILDHFAKELAGSNQRNIPNQVSPERYAECLRELMQQYPNLAAAYTSGTIAADDWSLAATLIPSIATEVRNKFGANPLNLRSGRYSGYKKYDNAGNQFRVYVK